jgi:hypothetical protein
MASVIVDDEINGSTHWLSSPKRQEIFGPLGITARSFLHPQNSHRAAVLLVVPDMAALMAAMQSDEVAAAMAFDGVKAETVVVFTEA